MSEVALTINVIGTELTLVSNIPLVSSQANYYIAQFTFDAKWADFTKVAVFHMSPESKYSVILDDENQCFIPSEATACQGIMFTGIYGINNAGDQIIPSNYVDVVVNDGSYTGAVPKPSPDIFAQIISIMQAQYHDAQTAIAKAEEARLSAVAAKASEDLITDEKIPEIQGYLADAENARDLIVDEKIPEIQGYVSAASGSADDAQTYSNQSKGYRDDIVNVQIPIVEGYKTAASDSADDSLTYSNQSKGYRDDIVNVQMPIISGYASSASESATNSQTYAGQSMGYRDEAQQIADAVKRPWSEVHSVAEGENSFTFEGDYVDGDDILIFDLRFGLRWEMPAHFTINATTKTVTFTSDMVEDLGFKIINLG